VDGVTLGKDGGEHRSSTHAASRDDGCAGWVRDGGVAGNAANVSHGSREHAERDTRPAQAKAIDWNDSFRGLGAGMAATNLGGRRGGQQPNLTEFNQKQNAGKKPRA